MEVARPRWKVWLYAFRPHTLGASIAPMMVVLGALVADGVFRWLPYLLCLVVAVSAQIASNLANDYFDFKGGQDTEARVGFERVLTTGKMSLREMRILLIAVLGITMLAGGILVLMEGWELLIIGLLVLLGVVGYSTGPFPLSHHALGDVAVVLFYGLIPILATYYAVAGVPPLYLLFLGLGVGLWEVNILVCNNYRDYEEDLGSGKRTLVVRMGQGAGPKLYAVNSVLSLICLFVGLLLEGSWIWACVILLVCGLFFVAGSLSIRRLEGRALNRLLIYTNRVSLIVGFLVMLALFL